MNDLSLKEINLDDLNFYGDIDFSGTSFFGYFNSSGTIENHINFRGAHFHSTASFTGSHFKNGSVFSGAKFYISGYFDGTHFYKNNNFKDLKLEKNSIASFKNAWFDQKAKFERAHLNGFKVDFSGAIFNMGADFMNADDTATLIFKDSLFNGKLTQFFVEDEIAYTHLLVNSFQTVHTSITMGIPLIVARSGQTMLCRQEAVGLIPRAGIIPKVSSTMSANLQSNTKHFLL